MDSGLLTCTTSSACSFWSFVRTNIKSGPPELPGNRKVVWVPFRTSLSHWSIEMDRLGSSLLMASSVSARLWRL